MNSTDRLTAFLYLLLRDEMSFGKVEKIVGEVENIEHPIFTEKTQANYAESLARRLTK